MDELEDVLVRYRPKLIYTNPTFQNPTGVTMPIRARRELLRLAERYRVPIVEDATYRELYFNEVPPPSLRELDAQNIVIYLNSFSKVLAPGLRLGWLSAAPSIVDQIAIIKQRLDPHTQNLGQFAMARFIRDGNFDTHLRTLRAEHARRCAMMIAAIQRHVPAGALRFARPQAGCISGAASRPASARARCSTMRWRPAWRSCPATRSIRIRRGSRNCACASRACSPTRSTTRCGGSRGVCERSADPIGGDLANAVRHAHGSQPRPTIRAAGTRQLERQPASILEGQRQGPGPASTAASAIPVMSMWPSTCATD